MLIPVFLAIISKEPHQQQWRNRSQLEQKQQLVTLQETDEYSKNINVDSFVNWSPEDFFNFILGLNKLDFILPHRNSQTENCHPPFTTIYPMLTKLLLLKLL